MKITVFNGSPRGRKSNSHQIIEPLLEGAKEAGAETEEVFLIERDIKHCLGCFACWEQTPGKCTIRDDMGELIDLYLDSDYVGLATPVYGMYMTGLLKNFTDRFLPLATPHIRKNEDGTFYHEGRVKRFPQQFFIANSGFPGEHNFDLLKYFMEIAKQSGQYMLLEVYRNCGEALQTTQEEDPRIYQKVCQFKDALRKAGREMVIEGQVSRGTVDQVHMELVSDEEYMNMANQYWDQKIDGS